VLRDLLNAAQLAFSQPDFTFQRVAITDLSLGGLTLDTVWALKNANAVSLSLASVQYALFIDGKQVLAGSPAQGLTIGAQSTSELHFPANIQFADVAAVVAVFLNQDTAQWKAEGSLGVDTPIGIIKLPLAHQGTFEVPKIPELSFGSPRVSGLSFTGATLEFPLMVTNKNSFALPISEVRGALSIAGSQVGMLSTGSLGELQGKGTKQLTLPLSVNFLAGAGAAMKAIQSGKAQVTFDAQVNSGTNAVPFKLDQLLSFSR
jgi:LEA14-like dessication related protein